MMTSVRAGGVSPFGLLAEHSPTLRQLYRSLNSNKLASLEVGLFDKSTALTEM